MFRRISPFVFVALVAIIALTACGAKPMKVASATPTDLPTATVVPTTESAVTTTPWPIRHEPVSVQDSYGFYSECHRDKISGLCFCDNYNYTVHIERENCDQHACPATITFTSEYGQSMWVDYFDTAKSVEIWSGDTVLLPPLDNNSWEIGSIPLYQSNSIRKP